jgi:deoxyribodipyrimidine photo-lyase
VTYVPYVEPAPGAGKGLLDRLAADACLVVTDDFPSFFLPRMVAAAGRRLQAMNRRLDAVDSNGILPLHATTKVFLTAYSFRSYLQGTLRDHLADWPVSSPDWSGLPRLGALPLGVLDRWPSTPPVDLLNPTRLLASLPLDHSVGVAPIEGGSQAARQTLARFVQDRLPSYAQSHSHPDDDMASGLSPYLHFGHISSHAIFEAVMTAEHWTSRRLGPGRKGQRAGWWGVSASAEGFLDQLITWRELGFNMSALRPDDHHQYASLPAWARTTLEAHAGDTRPYLYDLDVLRAAATHDRVWNAAQRQLSSTGTCHNYLRMVWGKKILEWTRSPEEALATMIALMDRLALDGRNPNSYSGYCWTLGRYDRPWGPERPVFGKVRYMSSDNTLRKLRMKRYLAAWSDASVVA